MSFRIDLDVETRLPERMRGMRLAARDLEPAWRLFDREVGKFFRKRFDTAGRHGGSGFGGLSRWKPLAPKTKRARLRSRGGNRGGVDRPLWDTGNLRASLVEVGPESIRNLGRQSYERGTRVPYAHFHQEGKGVPKREIVPEPLPDRMVRRAARLIEKHVVGG